MHDDEIDVTEATVRELLRRQFPTLGTQPLTRYASQGTVNAIYRLGPELMVRLPLTPRWHDIDLEACWLAALAPRIPIQIPEVVAIGDADDIYPWKWAIFRWIDGVPWRIEDAVDAVADAERLAETIAAVAAIDPRSLPCGKPWRRGSLKDLDEEARRTVASVRHIIDGDAFLAAWQDAVSAPDFEGKPPLCHGDLLAGNVLMHAGRLRAVIDWAGTCRADPAREAIVAWTLFTGESRAALRRALDVDDAAWRRAKGWALTRIFNVGYYEHSNPVFSADARRTIEAVLRD